MIKLLKGITWIKPKQLLNRFLLVILFALTLTLISEGIHLLITFITKLLGA